MTQGVAGLVPTTLYLVAEADDELGRAMPRRASSRTSPSCSGSRWRRPIVVPAWPRRCSRGSRTRPACDTSTGCCSRCARTTTRPARSTPRAASARSTGGPATTPTAPPRSSCPRRSHDVSEPLVLGIETSCDETGVGIVRGHTLLADAVASSVDEHARFGGVVPEVASRAHLEAMVPTIERACATAGIRPYDVDAIAVTSGPGLAGALLVGCRGREGARDRARQADLRRQPPRRPRGRRPARARRRCPSRAWRCWSAVATPACCGSRT